MLLLRPQERIIVNAITRYKMLFSYFQVSSKSRNASHCVRDSSPVDSKKSSDNRTKRVSLKHDDVCSCEFKPRTNSHFLVILGTICEQRRANHRTRNNSVGFCVSSGANQSVGNGSTRFDSFPIENTIVGTSDKSDTRCEAQRQDMAYENAIVKRLIPSRSFIVLFLFFYSIFYNTH